MQQHIAQLLGIKIDGYARLKYLLFILLSPLEDYLFPDVQDRFDKYEPSNMLQDSKPEGVVNAFCGGARGIFYLRRLIWAWRQQMLSSISATPQGSKGKNYLEMPRRDSDRARFGLQLC